MSLDALSIFSPVQLPLPGKVKYLSREEDPHEEQRVGDQTRSHEPNGADPKRENRRPHVGENAHVLEANHLRQIAKRVLAGIHHCSVGSREHNNSPLGLSLSCAVGRGPEGDQDPFIPPTDLRWKGRESIAPY